MLWILMCVCAFSPPCAIIGISATIFKGKMIPNYIIDSSKYLILIIKVIQSDYLEFLKTVCFI